MKFVKRARTWLALLTAGLTACTGGALSNSVAYVPPAPLALVALIDPSSGVMQAELHQLAGIIRANASPNEAVIVMLLAPGSRSYTVRPGDSLSSIAASNGLTLGAIEAANPQFGPVSGRNWSVIHAAQTFGLDPLPTWGITTVIVGALAAGMWAVTHYRTGWRRTVTIAALAVGLGAIGGLRYWFLWVTAGDAVAAVLEAVALTVFTTMMVWLGVLVLGFTKSRPVSHAEHLARSLRKRAEKKAAEEMTLERRMDAARTEFVADAQLFSFRNFQSDARRNEFLSYVRAELER